MMPPQQQQQLLHQHPSQRDPLSRNLQISPLKSDFYSMESRGFSSSPSISPSPTTPSRVVPGLSDEELAQLSVRQLNMKLQVN